MAGDFSFFVKQTWALTKKTLLIAVVRHWFSTIFRALALPIVFLVVLLNIKNILDGNSIYGVGSPSPIESLDTALSSSQKLVFVQPPGLGPDITRVVDTIANPLRERDQIVYLSDENDLLTICRQSLRGASDCFAAVIFNDSPLTVGKDSVWNYTIRADSRWNGKAFYVNRHNNDQDVVYLPLQLALENAITNSTIIPNSYMFTSISPAAADARTREAYVTLIINSYAIAFFITLISPVYHSVGMITAERESGMTQLIDAMGGSGAARILSYVLAFDIIYTPCWIIFGVLFWTELFPESNIAISIFWQVLTGWAITSASIFSAMFFNRAQLSGIYSSLGFLLVGLGGFLMDRIAPTTSSVAVCSLLFPSMNYIFMLGYMCRYEEQALPINLLQAAESKPHKLSTSRVPGFLFWIFLVLQIIIYPVLAIVTEKWVHGSTSRARTMGANTDSQSLHENTENSLVAIETTGLTKIYPPAFYKRLLTRGKAGDVVAVQDLDMVVRKGQVVCLLGANGSGKTTTLDMIGGLQKLTRGSIRISATASQIGICPQQNVLWNELTVDEHIKIWNEIKFSTENKTALEQLVEACDLKSKKSAQAGTLSGGQKRKLQLACMYVGGSKICLLDEVTSGLDPLSRRVIWNIILAERSKRTMILTTHFLDEADILADHVVIITRGRLRHQGSVVELKDRFGGGYKVHLRDANSSPQMGYPTKRLLNETIYELPDSTKAAEVISKLENAGHFDVYVNGPTIESVFLNVADEADLTQDESYKKSLKTKEDESVNAASQIAIEWDNQLSPGSDTSFRSQVFVLFRKRLTILSRNWWPYLLAVAMPIALTPNIKIYLDFYTIPSCLNLTANVHVAEPFNFQLGGFNSISELIKMLVGPASLNETLYNVVNKFPIGKGIDIQNFTGHFVLEKNISALQDYLSNNYTDFLPGALFMDSNSTSPTYAYVGDNGIFPALVMQNLWTQIRSGIPIVGYTSYFNSLISPKAGNTLEYVTYFSLAQAVYPAFFAIYPTYEKTRQVRALQYSNGIRSIPLWASYALFDFVFVLVNALACTIIIVRQAPGWFAAKYMFPVLFLYGLSATLFAYVVSIFARSQLVAFACAAGAQGLMFLISLMTFVVSSLQSENIETLIEAFTDSSNLQFAWDGSTFGLNLLFPIGNVVRATLVGLNVYVVNCRDGRFVSSPGSIYVYGGPIFYLCLQICFLFWLLLWLEGNHSFFTTRSRKKSKDDLEYDAQNVIVEVVNEKNRVEASESDLLRILNLTKSFGSVRAVDDVSFGISPGEILAVLGPNGAGKSTIINMIRGVLGPDDGRILLQGVDIVKQRRLGQKYLGVCPQFDALDLLTTRQHLKFYARAKGIKTIEQDVNLVMERTGLKPYEHRLASKLSGGNKRKLSLAIAVLGNPLVLLLDEPSSSMDAISKRVMWRTLAQVSSGRSLLLTTHSMEEADVLATRVAIISKRILALGTTDYLRQQHGNVYHVHIMLKSAPISTREETETVERWVERSFAGTRLDPYGNYHGQIKFSVPVSHPDDKRLTEDTINEVGESSQKRGGVGALLSLLEASKDAMSFQSYSIRATTMDEVFLRVIRENNVQEEGVVEKSIGWKLWRGKMWKFRH